MLTLLITLPGPTLFCLYPPGQLLTLKIGYKHFSLIRQTCWPKSPVLPLCSHAIEQSVLSQYVLRRVILCELCVQIPPTDRHGTGSWALDPVCWSTAWDPCGFLPFKVGSEQSAGERRSAGWSLSAWYSPNSAGMCSHPRYWELFLSSSNFDCSLELFRR